MSVVFKMANDCGGTSLLFLGGLLSSTDGIDIGTSAGGNRFISRNRIGAVCVVGVELDHLVEPNGLVTFLSIRCSDAAEYPLQPLFRITRGFIHSNLKVGLNVLVCCAQGISRSVSVVVDFLVASRFFASVDEAIVHLRALRPQINPNRGFICQLRNEHVVSKKHN